jgi:hypothetical protein
MIITTNNCRHYIASLYAPKSWRLISEMKAFLWPGANNHKLFPSGLRLVFRGTSLCCSGYNSETASVYSSCGSGREFVASFSISRGLRLAQPCWDYYIEGDDLQSSWLLASLAVLPITNLRPTSCHIWWLYSRFLHRRPQLVRDLCHGMLHTFNFLSMAMNSTAY